MKSIICLRCGLIDDYDLFKANMHLKAVCRSCGKYIKFVAQADLFCTVTINSNIKITGMIKLQIIGNLGKDCTVKDVNGKNVINFNVAHTESYKDKDGNKMNKTTWVECAYWTDKTAIAPYLTKGKMVYVEGAPEARGWKDKQGDAQGSLNVRVFGLQLLGGGNTEAAGGAQQAAQPQQAAQNSGSGNSAQDAVDDLPF